jgi:glutathione synthase/RimK-type ligase-like ATP-grasp enzyme
MSKHKLTIGCNDDTNIVEFLKDKYNIVKPYMMYRDGKIIKNFDIFLNFDGDSVITNKIKLFNIKSMGSQRYNKFEQHCIFNKLSIHTPHTYFCDNINMDIINMLLSKIDDDTNVIIKDVNGARGIGQVLIKKSRIYKLYNDIYADTDVDIKKLFKKYKIGGAFRNEHEVKYIVNTIKNGSFIIQEVVDKKAEWRYVYCYKNKPIIIKRCTTKTWQSNISVTGKHKNISHKKSKKIDKMNEIAETLSEYLNSPYLSIDFYEDKNGNIGVFEVQMNLGYDSLPKKTFVNLVISSTEKWINDKL